VAAVLATARPGVDGGLGGVQRPIDNGHDQRTGENGVRSEERAATPRRAERARARLALDRGRRPRPHVARRLRLTIPERAEGEALGGVFIGDGGALRA
jgi:hypothetical protein